MRKRSTEREGYQACLQRCVMAVNQLPAVCAEQSASWLYYVCVCTVTVCLSLHHYPQHTGCECALWHWVVLNLTSFICFISTVLYDKNGIKSVIPQTAIHKQGNIVPKIIDTAVNDLLTHVHFVEYTSFSLQLITSALEISMINGKSIQWNGWTDSKRQNGKVQWWFRNTWRSVS